MQGAVLSLVFRLSLLVSCLLPLASCIIRPTIKIGLTAPFEGRYRYVGYDVVYAVRLALREANAAGGVGGYSVELVAYDDGGNPTQAVEQARKLAVDPAVVAAIGHFRQETTEAALSAYALSTYAPSAYAEAGIPLVAPAVLYSPVAEEPGQVYHPGTPAEAVAGEMFVKLRGLGRRQAALVTEGGALGTALQWAAQQHRSLVSPVVSPQDADWVDEVLVSGVEVVFCDADPVTAGEAIAALRQAGWVGTFLGGPQLAAADFVAVAGAAAEGARFVTPYPFPADAPGSADFVAAYRTVSNGVQPGTLALPAYQATRGLLAAIERDITAHGEPTREGVAAALAEQERSAAPLYWYQAVSGKWQVVSSE